MELFRRHVFGWSWGSVVVEGRWIERWVFGEASYYGLRSVVDILSHVADLLVREVRHAARSGESERAVAGLLRRGSW